MQFYCHPPTAGRKRLDAHTSYRDDPLPLSRRSIAASRNRNLICPHQSFKGEEGKGHKNNSNCNKQELFSPLHPFNLIKESEKESGYLPSTLSFPLRRDTPCEKANPRDRNTFERMCSWISVDHWLLGPLFDRKQGLKGGSSKQNTSFSFPSLLRRTSIAVGGYFVLTALPRISERTPPHYGVLLLCLDGERRYRTWWLIYPRHSI